MLSVLMPIYNVENYLEKTLQSVACQTCREFEVIMVDDGSTDRSPAIADAFCEKDSRFRVIHTPNGGVSAARNRLLAEAKGEYLYFMDSDDLILPETFSEMMAILVENNADMVVGNIFYVDHEGVPIDKLNLTSPVKNETLTNIQYLKKLTEPNANYYCTVTNKIFKTALFDGILFPLGRINEDESRIHEVVYRCQKIVSTTKHYYTYIKHKASITGSRFSLKNLDRETAFYDRVVFFEEKGLDELASRASMCALDASLMTFSKCVTSGMYYGKVKNRLADHFAFFYKRAVKKPGLRLHERKILTVSWFALRFPELYEKYVHIRGQIGEIGFGAAFRDEVYEWIMRCFACLPTRDRIVFESHPEMSCNAYPVYRYLLEKGLQEKYQFIWLTEEKSRCPDLSGENVRFLTYSKDAKSVIDKLKYMYTIATAKALVYSNQLLGSYGHGRISLCLQHGMPLKRSSGTYCINDRCTACVCVSDFFTEKYCEDFHVSPEKLIYTGFPRNDLLLHSSDAKGRMGLAGFDKVIFWLPTFRQRETAAQQKTARSFEMEAHGTGFPALETGADLEQVNQFLQENNCLLLMKPHPSQDLSVLANLSLPNLRVITDETLREKGVQLYSLLGECDGLVTDYSSVYYDYLLCHKPIGLTIADLDAYKAKRGFVYPDPLTILKGEYIQNADDFLLFLTHIKNGEDPKKEEREQIAERVHSVTDGSSAQRVGDELLRLLGEM